MNIFDAIVTGLALVAIVFGYHAGLLRSLAVIFGYVLAAPLAVAFTPQVASALSLSESDQNGFLLFAVFVACGVLLGGMLRHAVSFAVGEDIGLADRLAGALLGAARIALLAILMVLVFERIIPQNRQPAWLAQSTLRPYFSAAGEAGIRTLPADLTAYIDRLKKERGL